jgi:hypothetical protein
MVRSAGMQQLTEESLQIAGQLGEATFSNSLYRGDKVIDGTLQTQGVEATTKPNQWTTFTQNIVGNQEFLPDDVVKSVYGLKGDGIIRKARVDISKPTKFLSFQVRVRKDALKGIRLIAKKYRLDDVTTQKVKISSQELSFSDSDTVGIQEAKFVDIYPKINTFYEIVWVCERAHSETHPTSEFLIQAASSSDYSSSNSSINSTSNSSSNVTKL